MPAEHPKATQRRWGQMATVKGGVGGGTEVGVEGVGVGVDGDGGVVGVRRGGGGGGGGGEIGVRGGGVVALWIVVGGVGWKGGGGGAGRRRGGSDRRSSESVAPGMKESIFSLTAVGPASRVAAFAEDGGYMAGVIIAVRRARREGGGKGRFGLVWGRGVGVVNTGWTPGRRVGLQVAD